MLEAEVDDRHQVGGDGHGETVHADDDDPVEVAEKNDDGDGEDAGEELTGAETDDIRRDQLSEADKPR